MLALEKEMATHSSVLAWRIPGTVEPDGLPSMGSHRVEHNWSDLAAAAAFSALLSKHIIDLKQTDFQIFLQQKWVYFGISKELQFGICDSGKPHASPSMAREGELFYRGKRKVGGFPGSMAFRWLNPCRESFFFLLGSVIIAWRESSSFRSLKFI